MMFEDITAAHIRAWGEPSFNDEHLICGFAGYSNEGRLAALFCAFPADGKWWVGFDRNEHCSRSVHKQIVKALDALASVEIDGERQISEVWAILDETKPRAREWMEHLGFEQMTATEWKLDISGRARKH